MLSIYDFNDWDYYFDKEEAVNAFIDKYGVDTCSLYELNPDGASYSELWWK